MTYRHLLLLIFLAPWLFIGLNLSQNESPTFDEPVHQKAAYLYSQGNFNFDPIEPPLLRRFVYLFAHDLPSARAIIVIITGILAAVLIGQPLAAFLFLTEPNLLAHSHYFTTDAVSAFLSVITALLLLTPSAPFLLTALFIAISASVKVATLVLIAPLLLIKAKSLGRPKIFFIICFTFIFIWATYGFHWQPIFNQLNLQFPFGGYLRAIKENILFSDRGQPIYFNGQILTHASILKTPLTILLKTTLPLLFLSLWATATRFRQTARYWLIFIIIFLVNLVKPLNFGIRHLLPAEIALILIASQVRPKNFLAKTLFSVLLIWQIVSFLGALPQPLTFTNKLTGLNPYQIFSDSDFDWGQGLIQLNKELKRQGITTFQLAYFGNIDPVFYLPHFIRIKDANPVGSLPIRELNYQDPIIISVTCYYQCGYYQDPILAAKPQKIIAKSFLIFND